MGYNDVYTYKNPTPSPEWMEDWTNVQIGGSLSDPSQDFKTQGAYLTANFTNLNDPTTRQLNSITFGAASATGNISADFNSFSGTISDSGGNPQYNGEALNLGNKTISCDNSAVSISLSLAGADKGFWINITNATVH